MRRRDDVRIDHAEPYALANVLMDRKCKWDLINFGCTVLVLAAACGLLYAVCR